jgi:hypothetical protein
MRHHTPAALATIALIFAAPLLSACSPTQRFTIDNQTTQSASVRAVPAYTGAWFSGTEAWCMDVVKPGTTQTLEYNQKNTALKQRNGPAVFSLQIGSAKANPRTNWLLHTKESCDIVIAPDRSLSVIDAKGQPVHTQQMTTSPWEEWMFRMFD